jgi:LPXTG-motif cell wall-anchored protein
MICAKAQPVPEGELKMVRRSLAALGLALAALVLFAPVASAQYVDDGSLVTDDPNPDVGDSITITGTGCGEPGVDVTVSISQGANTVVLGTVTTGPDGTYTFTATVPSSFSNGTAVISDTCGASLTITIGAVSGTSLPRTGSETGTMWRVAVALVAAGGVLVLGARKRSNRVTVDA